MDKGDRKKMSEKSKIIINFNSKKEAEEFLEFLIRIGCLSGKLKDYEKEAKKK